MIKISEILDDIIHQFSKAGIPTAKTEAEMIISHIFKLKKFDIYLQPDHVIEDKIHDEINALVKKRCQHYPLQYILKEIEFHHITLKITTDVLIPRPETELLVEIIIKNMKNDYLKVLDLCTGSGAIAIALKNAKPNWQITASDISEKALNIAHENAKSNNCQIDFVHSDLFSSIKQKFDLIVSNPPYISESNYQKLDPELFYEPSSALVAPENGIFFYRKIIENCHKFLNLPASIFLEIGQDQVEKITNFANNCQIKNVILKKDYNNLPRYLIINF